MRHPHDRASDIAASLADTYGDVFAKVEVQNYASEPFGFRAVVEMSEADTVALAGILRSRRSLQTLARIAWALDDQGAA